MPRHLNPRFHAYIAQSRRIRITTTLATLTLLITTAGAFALTTDQGAELRASLTRNISPARDAATSFLKSNFVLAREKIPRAVASISNISSQARTPTPSSVSGAQLAAGQISSDNFLQWLGTNIYRALCPLFTDCAQETESAPTRPQPPQLTQTDHDTNSINVKPTASYQPAELPPRDGTATNVAVSASPPKTSPPPTPAPKQTTNQPVIDRVVETIRTEPGVNISYVDERLSLLENSLLTRMDTQIDGIVRSMGFGGGGGSSGSVTSVNASGGTTGLSFSGGPITSSGTLTLSGTLAVGHGGTAIATAPSYGQTPRSAILRARTTLLQHPRSVSPQAEAQTSDKHSSLQVAPSPPPPRSASSSPHRQRSSAVHPSTARQRQTQHPRTFSRRMRISRARPARTFLQHSAASQPRSPTRSPRPRRPSRT